MRTRLKIATRILALGLVGAAVHAESLNGLSWHVQINVIARTSEVGHFFFLPNGRYAELAPEGEIGARGMEQACAKYKSSCGTYTLAGSKLTLKSDVGKVQNLETGYLLDSGGPQSWADCGADGLAVCPRLCLELHVLP
jgi:hypothetical protein